MSQSESIKLITKITKGMSLTLKISGLPEVTVTEELKEICAICQNPLENGKKLLCGHIFHESCLL